MNLHTNCCANIPNFFGNSALISQNTRRANSYKNVQLSCQSALPLLQLFVCDCSREQCSVWFSKSHNSFFVVVCTLLQHAELTAFYCTTLHCLHFIKACCIDRIFLAARHSTVPYCITAWMGHTENNYFLCLLAVTGVLQCTKIPFTAQEHTGIELRLSFTGFVRKLSPVTFFAVREILVSGKCFISNSCW